MAWTKAKRRKYNREYMREYRKKESHQRYVQKVHQVHNRVNYERLWELKKSRGCLHCGLNDPRCLDFHHRDPSEKNRSVAGITSLRWEVIELEVAKCEILCSNCHRIETFRQQNYAGVSE